MRLITLTILVFLSAANSYAQNVGLKPTFFSLGSAEAMTANATGTEALYYNPAGLSWHDISIRLVGIEKRGDAESLKTIDEILNTENPEEYLNLETLYTRLNSDEPIYANATARLVDVILPFVGVGSFIDGKASSNNFEEDGNTYHDLSFQTDVGLIVGAGFSYKKLGVGVSYYRIGRSKLISTPTTAQRDTVIEAIDSEQLSEDTAPFREFSKLQYGGAEGYNIGLQYRADPNSYTGVGVSVLNVGGTKFSETIDFDDSTLDSIEEALLAEVDSYGFERELPEDIAETTNLGLSWGLTGRDSPFHFVLNLEANDVSGDYIEDKYAVSAKIGLTLPDSLALLASVPIIPIDQERENYVHLGVLGLYVFGGYRPNAYQSTGATLAMHLGFNRIASIVKAELTALSITPTDEDSRFVAQAGTLITAGLTLIVDGL